VVQFYDCDADLVSRAGDYLLEGLRTGAVSIVIADGAHRASFEAHLRDGGVDLDAARDEGALVSLDAAATLAQLMRDGRVDREAFFEVVGGVVRTAAATGRPVRAYGEMVALLWEAGDVMAAIDLETYWNELATEVPFELYCAYRSESVSGHEHADALAQVCHLHSDVVEAPPVETTWQFAADARAATAARRVAIAALRRAGHERRLLDDAQLVITELATNAVRHARTPFSLSIRMTRSAVRIRVRDRSHAVPALRGDPGVSSSGRGMRIVSALASRWGVDHVPDGKVVWAELAARPSRSSAWPRRTRASNAGV
jgi:anti-sigma regulatory factor (Ser/Thr protein kinase)